MNLEGRSGLITGGSRGLGLEIARRYAGAGARLVIAARNADALTCAADELRAIAGAADRVETVAGDVTRPEDVHAMRFLCVAIWLHLRYRPVFMKSARRLVCTRPNNISPTKDRNKA